MELDALRQLWSREGDSVGGNSSITVSITSVDSSASVTPTSKNPMFLFSPYSFGATCPAKSFWFALPLPVGGERENPLSYYKAQIKPPPCFC